MNSTPKRWDQIAAAEWHGTLPQNEDGRYQYLRTPTGTGPVYILVDERSRPRTFGTAAGAHIAGTQNRSLWTPMSERTGR